MRRFLAASVVCGVVISGVTIASALGKLGEGAAFGQLAIQGAIEDAVLDLLDDEPTSSVEAA